MTTHTIRIREIPLPERPRERLVELGATALSVPELLAILIGTGTRGRSAVVLASEVLRASGGSLRRLAVEPSGGLEQIRGVGPVASARIAAALELGRRLAREGPLERTRIRGPADVYDRCAPALRDLQHEEFRILLLNT